VSGCAGTTTTPLASANGRPTYRIECIEVSQCWTEARRACRGAYRALATHENQIPDSDISGLNERTRANATGRGEYVAGMPMSAAPSGPGIESSAPLPIVEVVVMCTSDG
jgi:hypothetical protein